MFAAFLSGLFCSPWRRPGRRRPAPRPPRFLPQLTPLEDRTLPSTFTVLNLNDSGAGLGGGAFNDATSTLALTDSSVTRNHANGSPEIGGGIYTLGTFTFDA